ncbi:MAG: para-aminobenzoate synthetase component 1 [Verrucomicrobiales bacterium]|jgi:para-aminobenzoate synthetase component 1
METIDAKPLKLSLSPNEVARRLHKRRGFVYLDSADAAADTHHLSILTADPTCIHTGNLTRDADRLRAALDRHQSETVDCGFPLGGLFGHVAYDGQFTFGEYESLLAYHHHKDRWYVVGEPSYLDELREAPDNEGLDLSHGSRIQFASDMNKPDFVQRVTRAQEWIADGDIYQANLAHQFRAKRQPDQEAFALYEHLRAVSPAPFSAYFSLDDQQILSSSPECFLKMSGRGITTRPIKGTRPRFSDSLLDEKSAYDLITSPKEVSELIMITDLERNDLGRICDYGSVRVRELLALERYAQVFHLVSTVQGELRPDIDHVEALRLCSPGGSITGAPKKRAMEIIEALEPTPRGLYTGAIGYLGWNGESQFNIAIRTLIGERDHWHFHVGAGIVADSDPTAEYEETLHKAAGILKATDAYCSSVTSIRTKNRSSENSTNSFKSR